MELQILPSLAWFIFKIKIKIKFETKKYICTKNKLTKMQRVSHNRESARCKYMPSEILIQDRNTVIRVSRTKRSSDCTKNKTKSKEQN